MRAAWWWIDRWRKSTAYTDMTAEAQGVYRNLLDELWLRDGALPADERILRKIGGDYEAWDRVREVVLARFVLVDGQYRNETHDEVAKGCKDFRESQSKKGKKGAEARWKKGRAKKKPMAQPMARPLTGACSGDGRATRSN